MTTIKVDTSTRDQLRSLMGSETYDELLRRLIRSERQRRMAAELSTWEPTADEHLFAREREVERKRPFHGRQAGLPICCGGEIWLVTRATSSCQSSAGGVHAAAMASDDGPGPFEQVSG